MSITSYFSFFSLFVILQATCHGIASVVYELNEEKAKIVQHHREIFSVVSCNSFFSYFVTVRATVRKISQYSVCRSLLYSCFASFVSGVKSEGQHTRCTHRVLPRLAGGAAPSTPEKGKRQVTP